MLFVVLNTLKQGQVDKKKIFYVNRRCGDVASIEGVEMLLSIKGNQIGKYYKHLM